ncbi:hypothetical protein O3Q52_19290 [Streptomyces sp. ActVer]|uniref:hypothetical protein n=1 Tax=Streptomyces sp. ActVer TaxID=3014558 RepID=UPI0022B536D4|nr:hypothetical protein [Streptomyces sp. ActVer]MCZ4510295.1 hypothetical protein [Streptomyces sp. ActVer]
MTTEGKRPVKTYGIQTHRRAQQLRRTRRNAMALTIHRLRAEDQGSVYDEIIRLFKPDPIGELIEMVAHLAEGMANMLEKECGSKEAAAESLAQQIEEAEEFGGAFGDAVLVDIRAYELALNGRPAVRATAALLDAANGHRPVVEHATVRPLLSAALASARDSSAQDGELFLTGPLEALGGREAWAQLDPDGYVLMFPEDV